LTGEEAKVETKRTLPPNPVFSLNLNNSVYGNGVYGANLDGVSRGFNTGYTGTFVRSAGQASKEPSYGIHTASFPDGPVGGPIPSSPPACECGSTDSKYENFQLICSNCGILLQR